MNIRLKVLTLKLISTLFLLVTYSLFSKTFLISGFKEVEKEEVLSDTEVIMETFNSMIANLDTKGADWSAWDESYSYVQRKNKAFEKANFLPETMKLLNLDYFAFFDSKGQAVGHRAFDKHANVFTEYPKSLERVFRPGSRLFQFTSAEASHRGVLSLPEGLIMFSLRPVFNSKMAGPSKGYLLMIRRLSGEVAARLSEITGRHVSFESPEMAEVRYGVTLQNKVVQKELSEDLLLAMVVLHDFHNIPVAVIKTEIPRKILQIGMTSYKKTMTFITTITILMALIMMVLLNRMLIKPLADLDEQVNLLNENGDSELAVEGNDEVSRLAKSMNQMLGTLHTRNDELMNLNEIIKNQNHALVSAAKMSALGEMAGGVAHEINTPLTVIKLRSEMIMNELDQNPSMTNTRLKSSLEIIDKTVDRITKIVQSLRAFSRETAGHDKIEYSVSSIVSEALNLCHEKFKIHGIDLSIDISEDFILHCRPTEITQVLVNLLNNSYDAVEGLEEKTISIRTKKLDNENLEISVTDTGKGIPLNIQDKIMQPFFTTKELGKGTGIGLSISKGIIESHGGKLYLDQAAKNTKIVVLLPYLKSNSKTFDRVA